MSNKIAEARSLALQFMSANPCCIRAIPYGNGSDPQSLTICLYVDTDGKGIPKDVKHAAEELFAKFHIEFDDLQQRPLSKIVTPLPSSEKRKDLSCLSRAIEKNLDLFENRLNVTAIQASYKVTDSIEQDIPCVTVFVLGKGRVPAGETNINEIKQPNDYPFDVVEGYYQPADGSSNTSYAFYLRGGVGIGVQGVPGAGTLGGFLEDEEKKCYILSNEHVLHPSEVGNNINEIIIQQPAQLDYDTSLEKARNDLVVSKSKKLKLIGEGPEPTKSEIDLKNDEYFGPIMANYDREITEAEYKLKKIENERPRQIGKYVCGLQSNVPPGDNYPEMFVDAAIAALDEEEFKRMKTDKYAEAETNRCPLYGFKNINGIGLNCNTINIENFVEELPTQNSELSFMKIGRTSGLTNMGRIDPSGKELFVNGISSLYHVKFQYCNDCIGVRGEGEIHQNEYIQSRACARCGNELNNDNEVRSFWLRNCLVIRQKSGEAFCKKGDSGALLFGSDGRAWGLVFGVFKDLSRDMVFCLASPISATLKALEVLSRKKLKLW